MDASNDNRNNSQGSKKLLQMKSLSKTTSCFLSAFRCHSVGHLSKVSFQNKEVTLTKMRPLKINIMNLRNPKQPMFTVDVVYL